MFLRKIGCAIVLNVMSAVVYADNSLFIIRTTDMDTASVVEAVSQYSQDKGWNYLGASQVKKGEVTLVKFCIPEVGKKIWAQGLYLSALVPCGNMGVYQKDGKTEVSVLSPRYLQALVPSPEMEEAVKVAEPAITEMLDVIIK